MKLKVVPDRPYVCVLDGRRFETLKDLDKHLKEDHNTTMGEMKHIAISTTGQQGPFKK